MISISRLQLVLRRRCYGIFNYLKLYMHGVTFGSNCQIFDSFYIRNIGNIAIGNDYLMTSMGGYNPLCRNLKGAIVAEKGASIRIGNHCHMSSPCIWARKSIVIGNDVKLGGDVIIIDSDAHSLNFEDRRIGLDNLDAKNANSAEVIIGNDVLIGTKCIILKGSKIGDRTIIGAGSVVAGEIPEDCIAAGNPCKVIRKIER